MLKLVIFMRYKTLLAITLLSLLITPLFAKDTAKILINTKGEIEHYWIDQQTLKISRSIDQAKSFSPPKTLLSFAHSLESFDIQSNNTKYFLVYEANNNIYYTFSKDNGTTFSLPAIITSEGKDAAIARKDRAVILAWARQDQIIYQKAVGNENIFGQPYSLKITDESLSEPKLIIDDLGQVHLFFKSYEPKSKQYRLLYARIDNQPIVKEIYTSLDKIDRIQAQAIASGLFVSWQDPLMYAISLDNGSSFHLSGIENQILPIATLVITDKLYNVGLTNDPDKLTFVEIAKQEFMPPLILYPINNKKYSNNNLYFKLNPGFDPSFMKKIEVSVSAKFPKDQTYSFEQIGTQEIKLPLILNDGKYYSRASYSNGLFSSPYSETISFILDNIQPEVKDLSVKRKKQHLTITGKTTKADALLTINSLLIPVNNSSFEAFFDITPGKNVFDLLSSDEAGNIFIGSIEVFYNCSSPEIESLSPSMDQWYRSDSSIFLEADIFDLENDLSTSSPISLTLNNILIDHSLEYDQDSHSLSGFVNLPKNLAEGKHKLILKIEDQAKNKGSGVFEVNLDNSAPIISYDEQHPFYINNIDHASLEVFDQGAGLDINGSQLFIQGLTFEALSSIENAYAIRIKSYPNSTSFEAQITARDKIGNLSQSKTFSLIIDTLPPTITLFQSQETNVNHKSYRIQGQLVELYPDKIKIFNNDQLAMTCPLNSENFDLSLPLTKGNNNIKVQAFDRAGNSCQAQINVFARINSGTGLINEISNGPNPFSRSKDNEIIFELDLADTCDIKLYVFDLIGNLRYKKEYPSCTSGILSWNSIDQFGNQLGNGVYPYLVVAELSGQKEIQRGKIIIYN